MCAVRSALVVELPPTLDEHPGLSAASEPFTVQQRVTPLAVKALDEAVLPGTARSNEGRTDCRIAQPVRPYAASRSECIRLRARARERRFC